MQMKGLEMSFIKRHFGHDTLICVYFFEEKKPLFSYVEQVFNCKSY